MLTFICPNCQATFKVPEGQAGARGKCGRCGHSTQVPRTLVTDRLAKGAAVPVRAAEADNIPDVGRRPGVPRWVLVIGIACGILAVLLLAMIPFALRNRGGRAVAAQSSNESEGSNPGALSRTAQVCNIGKEIRFGDLGVTVMRGRVEAFGSVTSSGHVIVHDPGFVITIALRNYNPNRVVEVGSQADIATAADDVGNRYRAIKTTSDIGLPTRIVGQIPPGKSLGVRSDEPDGDLLVFDRPVPGASLVRLTLDSSRYGGSGSLQVDIPFKEVIRIQVQSNRDWQDTGIDTMDGSQMTLTYKGNWSKGNMTCTVTGIAPADDLKMSPVRQLKSEYDEIQKQWRDQTARAKKAEITARFNAPSRMPGETKEAWQRRVEAARQENEPLKQRARDAAAREKELQKKMEDLLGQKEREKKRVEERRVMGQEPLMCLVAKLGTEGTAFLPRDKIVAAPPRVGRLFLQANDLDLAENNGSLEVEIVLFR